MLETIKRLNERIKNNPEMSQEEKERSAELLAELARIVAMY